MLTTADRYNPGPFFLSCSSRASQSFHRARLYLIEDALREALDPKLRRMMTDGALFLVSDLRVEFGTERGMVYAVNGISF